MIRSTTGSSRFLLLAGGALLALAACSSDAKGPGALGSKNDIVVHNNGLPGAQQQAAQGDFSSTVEQAQAMPAPAVGEAESLTPPERADTSALPEVSPAVDHAAQAVANQTAPVPSTTNAPMMQGTPSSADPVTTPGTEDIAAAAPVTAPDVSRQDLSAAAAPQSATGQIPSGTVVSAEPDEMRPSAVPAIATPTTAPSTVYPAEDYPVSTAPSVPSSYHPGINAAPEASASRLSADAMAPAAPETTVSAAAATTSPAPANLPPAPSDFRAPQVVASVQAALHQKGVYNGPQNGEFSAEFLNALSRYQGDNHLPQGGVNAETMRQLDLIQ